MSNMYIDYNDVLCHYGVKGMKWGVRRYQNEDGSLTAAGRARYGVSAAAAGAAGVAVGTNASKIASTASNVANTAKSVYNNRNAARVASYTTTGNVAGLLGTGASRSSKVASAASSLAGKVSGTAASLGRSASVAIKSALANASNSSVYASIGASAVASKASSAFSKITSTIMSAVRSGSTASNLLPSTTSTALATSSKSIIQYAASSGALNLGTIALAGAATVSLAAIGVTVYNAVKDDED